MTILIVKKILIFLSRIRSLCLIVLFVMNEDFEFDSYLYGPTTT